MKLLIQRVNNASVSVDNAIVGEIQKGLLVFIGLKPGDSETECDYLIKKILKLRVFPEGFRSMEQNVVDCGYEILIVSQFTLYADCNKGNRPSFAKAMAPDQAEVLYNEFLARLKTQYPKIQEGVFGADMQVSLVNEGPITIELSSKA